jgi:hypothetical protein
MTPADPTGRMQEVQMAYVDGYILALEDVLKDLEDLRSLHPSVSTGQTVRRTVGKSLQAARETLGRLKEGRS